MSRCELSRRHHFVLHSYRTCTMEQMRYATSCWCDAGRLQCITLWCRRRPAILQYHHIARRHWTLSHQRERTTQWQLASHDYLTMTLTLRTSTTTDSTELLYTTTSNLLWWCRSWCRSTPLIFIQASLLTCSSSRRQRIQRVNNPMHKVGETVSFSYLLIIIPFHGLYFLS